MIGAIDHALQTGVAAAWRNLYADERPARCMACLRMRPVAPGWCVGTYKPYHPAHPPIVYLLCPKCAQSEGAIRRAKQTIETRSRAIAEGERIK
ncbi:hypothetical protein [Comamonas sp. NLF-1-9]|uniref:hypothetical protein n=1 Tax=Comamonas sp. NLF-1-9 TaxID=2853163 RepID=UPI001C44D7BD|nr:hypothetical protein [Comamonas sp. NLF-1-9]QXL83154.1 hypothetical protein KUD94_07630 [Comamonas sp. NLF-1-9]